MRLAVILVATALVATAVALPVVLASHTPPGQIVCREQTPNCGKKVRTVSGDVHVDGGQTKTYKDATYLFTGSVFVHGGGTVVSDNAVLLFGADSLGIQTEPNGRTEIRDSVLQTDPNATSQSWGLELQTGSSLVLVNTRIIHGLGVTLHTDDAVIEKTSFEDMETALRLIGRSLTISGNSFSSNELSVYQEGGSPTLRGNSFDGGTVCIRNYRSNPTIDGNTMVGCHTGVEHIESHSSIINNILSDDGVPPGAGFIIDGAGFAQGFGGGEPSPVIIENNTITDYHTGVIVRSGRAHILHNDVSGNVLDGIRVEDNVAAMEIVGNTVSGNGGHGIVLLRADNVTVQGNTVSGNGGAGTRVEASTAVTLDGNTHSGNVGDGVSALDVDGLTLLTERALDNGGAGFRLDGVSRLDASDLDAIRNEDGVVVTRITSQLALTRLRAEANVVDGIRADVADGTRGVRLERPLLFDNGRDGVRNTGPGEVALTYAWIEGNVDHGARTDHLDGLISAPNAYWGSSTGPRHSLNPGGEGDRASDGVVYLPFATSEPQ